jgi:hypothetical protein
MDCKGPALARPTLVHEATCVPPKAGTGQVLTFARRWVRRLCTAMEARSFVPVDALCRRVSFLTLPQVTRCRLCWAHRTVDHMSRDMVGCRPHGVAQALWEAFRPRRAAGSIDAHFRRRKWIGAQRLESSLDTAKIEEKLLARSNPSHAEQTKHAPCPRQESIASNREQAGQNGSLDLHTSPFAQSVEQLRGGVHADQTLPLPGQPANVDKRGRLGCVRQMPCRVLKAKLSAAQRNPVGRSAVRTHCRLHSHPEMRIERCSAALHCHQGSTKRVASMSAGPRVARRHPAARSGLSAKSRLPQFGGRSAFAANRLSSNRRWGHLGCPAPTRRLPRKRRIGNIHG